MGLSVKYKYKYKYKFDLIIMVIKYINNMEQISFEVRETLNEVIEAIEFTNEYENKENWEYQAKRALDLLNDNRYRWNYLTPKQKISESHNLYDRVFRSTTIKTGYVSKEIWDLPKKPRGGVSKNTEDHVFNARTAMRILMDDCPPFMNNFDEFKHEFKRLLLTVGLTKKQNQDVKVKGNGHGEIKMDKTTKDRYSNITFVNINTYEVCDNFPLEIPDWYHQGELKRLN
tara:strand:- start:199 stop:885 length:687 start_codon:yes stop_codon:yes gene_type:complete